MCFNGIFEKPRTNNIKNWKLTKTLHSISKTFRIKLKQQKSILVEKKAKLYSIFGTLIQIYSIFSKSFQCSLCTSLKISTPTTGFNFK